MSYMEDQIQRQYEAWMEQEREWYTMVDYLVREGWHHVRLDKALNQQELNEMNDWLKEHYYGRHESFNDEVLLPTEKDATWFLMRWSS